RIRHVLLPPISDDAVSGENVHESIRPQRPNHDCLPRPSRAANNSVQWPLSAQPFTALSYSETALDSLLETN
ncbi:uncharacterized protein B0H18DRAFT_978863, partial [Fomitopsis serialis]|uniref:uncharacterized protein n=1 Tax=Fomitopsis serialis TaxID=139415 RepID=UPI002007F4B2